MTQTAPASPPLTSQLFVNGEFRDGSGGVVADVNPATEKVLLDVSAAGTDDVDAAVRAARAAFEGGWGASPAPVRGRLLSDLAMLIERDAAVLARLEALDVGKPVGHTLARRVRAGSLWVNGWGALDPALPWGGMKSSGIGRELGWSGIVANTEEKVITVVL